jgi:polygalacturonase
MSNPVSRSILEFGAVADGRSDCTRAIADAIAAVSDAGGGRVVVPAGTFRTGPIQFRSRIELHLQHGALVQFSDSYDDYPLVESDYEGEPTVRCMSPLWATEASDIAITGDGVFDGAGQAWRAVKRSKMTEQQWAELVRSGGVVDKTEDRELWWPTEQAMRGEATLAKLRASGKPLSIEDYRPVRDYLRPTLLKFSQCRNVRLEGPTFRNSPAWNVHLLLCENVTVRHVTILNPWWSQNGDGIDIDACRNVRLEHSHFDCGDDAICIKSGKNEAGRRRGARCENVLVDNCVVLHGHGGVTVGSEMSGGVRNLRVSNCVFRGTDIGLRFKSTRGRGGVVENVEISNVAMHDIRHDAISLNLYYWVKDQKPKVEPVNDGTPTFRGFTFRNITCDGAGRGIEIRGLPENPIADILLENVRIDAKVGAVLIDATNVTLANVKLTTQTSPAMTAHNVRNLSLRSTDAAGPLVGLDGGRVGDL